MNWLQKLLSIDAPENTVLQSWDWSWRGLFPWGVAVAILAVAAAAAFFLYFQERARLGVVRRALLALLRTGIIALVLVLLLRPVLQATFGGERARPVVVLLDNSQSMKQQDRRLSEKDHLRVAIARGLVPPNTAVTASALLASIPADKLKDPARDQLVKDVLSNPDLKLLDGLKRRGPVQAFLFGQRLRSLEDLAPSRGAKGGLEQQLQSKYEANEGQTALAEAVHDLLVRSGGDLPAGIVVMTDGRDNASKLTLKEAAQECREAKVPLYIYGVGSSEGLDLQLKNVVIPNTIFVEDKVQIRVGWRCQGVKQGKVVLRLALGDQRLEPVEIDVGGKQVHYEHEITLEPARGPEQRELNVSVELKGNEAVQSVLPPRRVRVVDKKVKVLYVENTPRWEYKFLQPALLRDHRVEARFLLTEGDAAVLQGGPPFLEKFPERFPETGDKDPDKRPFDLLILGDVPLKTLGEGGVHSIQKFVNEGGGLVCIAGRWHMPAEYAEGTEAMDGLAEVLPVELHKVDFQVDPEARREPFQPALTPEGEHSEWSSMLALADTPEANRKIWKEDLWKDIRGFYWQYPVTRLRSGARALLVNPEVKMPDKAGPRPMPVMAAHHYGKGQVLFLGTDETWRWRYNAQNRYLARFWGQVVYQMGLPHLLGNSERVQLSLSSSKVYAAESARLYARLLDENNEPLRAARVLARVHYLKGGKEPEPLELKPIAGQDGEYQALLSHEEPGPYEIKDLQLENGVSLPPASLPYYVDTRPGQEKDVAGMAEDELREAADLSGGKFYREEELHHLAADVAPQKAAFVQRQEVVLWNPLTLLLFVGLITVEWTVRKFSNLS